METQTGTDRDRVKSADRKTLLEIEMEKWGKGEKDRKALGMEDKKEANPQRNTKRKREKRDRGK